MFSRKTTFFACGLIMLPAAGMAQNSGTQAEQDACTPDVFSLCQDFIPNEAPIVACLQAKRRQLSPACSAVMFPKVRAARRSGNKLHHHRRHQE